MKAFTLTLFMVFALVLGCRAEVGQSVEVKGESIS